MRPRKWLISERALVGGRPDRLKAGQRTEELRFDTRMDRDQPMSSALTGRAFAIKS